jgi:hypothetical protein
MSPAPKVHLLAALLLLLLPPASATAQAASAPAAIPEPAAVALFVLGVGVIGAAVRRRKG